MVHKPSYISIIFFNATYYDLKQILQDKHITMENEEKVHEIFSFEFYNQCFLV